MSENGPREGTRDLPKASSDTGHRAPDNSGSAGVAYTQLSKSLRRRRAELVALAAAGTAAADIARSYEADHPLEPTVTTHEIELAFREAKRR